MNQPSTDRRHLVAPWLLGAFLILGWQLTVTLGHTPAFMLPGPGAVLIALGRLLGQSASWAALGTTVIEALGGCLLGILVAIPLAVLIHRSRWISAAVIPFLGATQAIPAVAIAPVLVLWVGYGLKSVVILCALLVFFPILVSTVVGLRHVPRPIVDAARIDGACSWALLRHVEFPMALPNVLAGIRNGFTLSVTGAIVGEMVMGGTGLGQLLTVQRDALDTAGMFATIALLCVLASGVYGLISGIERRSKTMRALA